MRPPFRAIEPRRLGVLIGKRWTPCSEASREAGVVPEEGSVLPLLGRVSEPVLGATTVVWLVGVCSCCTRARRSCSSFSFGPANSSCQASSTDTESTMARRRFFWLSWSCMGVPK